MDHQELNAVLKRYSAAWRQYMSPPAMHGEKPALPSHAQAAINKLQAEASRLPDPGGPLTNYSAALAAWAATNHPDIDSMEMNRHILDKLVLDHR